MPYQENFVFAVSPDLFELFVLGVVSFQRDLERIAFFHVLFMIFITSNKSSKSFLFFSQSFTMVPNQVVDLGKGLTLLLLGLNFPLPFLLVGYLGLQTFVFVSLIYSVEMVYL